MNQSRVWRFWKQHIQPFVLTLTVLTSFRSAVADWNIVPTGSMNPTIVEGDRIFVNKLAYGLNVPFTTWHVARWSNPQRGEVVVFNSPVDGGRLVKRVAAVPGDTIAMINNRLYINGQAAILQPLDAFTFSQLAPQQWRGHVYVDEQLGQHLHPMMTTPSLPARRNFAPITLPPGCYFMLGDNRDNSADSRYFGFVSRDQILGRSSRVVLSFDPQTHWPSWTRTLRSLP